MVSKREPTAEIEIQVSNHRVLVKIHGFLDEFPEFPELCTPIPQPLEFSISRVRLRETGRRYRGKSIRGPIPFRVLAGGSFIVPEDKAAGSQGLFEGEGRCRGKTLNQSSPVLSGEMPVTSSTGLPVNRFQTSRCRLVNF